MFTFIIVRLLYCNSDSELLSFYTIPSKNLWKIYKSKLVINCLNSLEISYKFFTIQISYRNKRPTGFYDTSMPVYIRLLGTHFDQLPVLYRARTAQ